MGSDMPSTPPRDYPQDELEPVTTGDTDTTDELLVDVNESTSTYTISIRTCSKTI